jgi:hypothetical protein
MISGVKKSSVIPDLVKGRVKEAVREQVSNVEFGGGAELPKGIPGDIRDEIVSISHESVTRANRTAIVFAASFSILAFLLSFLLPGKRQQEQEGESLAVHLSK